MQATRVSSLIGHVVKGRYRVADLLGQGASGAVYLVRDEQNPQKLFILKEVARTARGERRGPFSEAFVLRRLNHPALPRVHRTFGNDKHDRFYLLMDYVKGTNLEALRQSAPGKRFSLPRAITLMSPVMDAVSYLHRQRPHLVHGDIKPANIITLPVGAPTPSVLVDLGGIRDLDADAHALNHQDSLHYRAPEQFGGKASRRSDVYALGAVFYTLLTGVVPVAAPARQERLAEGEPDPLLPMDQIMPHVRATVAEVVHRALSINRRDRFGSVEQFWSALWRVIYNDPVVADLSPEEQMWLSEMSDASRSEEEFVSLLAEAASAWKGTPAATATNVTTGLAGLPDLTREKTPLLDSSIPDTTVVLPRRQGNQPVVAAREENTSQPAGSVVKRRRRRSEAWIRVALIFLLVCVIGSGVTFAGYQVVSAKYQNGMALADMGVQHLQTALSLLQGLSKNPFNASSVTQAQREFASAAASFIQLNAEVQSLPGATTSIPVYGSRLSTAQRVVPLALTIAQAGVAGAAALNIIISRLHNPLSAGQGLRAADLTDLSSDIRQVEADVAQASEQVNALRPADLQFDARISKAVAAFHTYLPFLQTILRTVNQLLPVLPALLGVGAPAYYLVEILDSTQLRPGGGYIKDYGLATLLGGQLSTAHVANAVLLDKSFAETGQTLPYPPAYRWFDLSSSWSLRDSNLDADFPTAAAYAEQNYRLEGGKVPLQGVIAITPAFMEDALAITGPISISELHQTVTAQNLLSLLHYYELGPGYQGSGILTSDGHLTPSRYFAELLAEHFLASIRQLPSVLLPKLSQMLVTALHTKDLQIYFNASPAESLLQLFGVGAQIQAPAGDSVLVVDANIAGNTANQFITSTLNDQVTIDSSGDAIHRTTIRYAWSKRGSVYGPPVYRDYARVYVPPGSALQAQQGWQPRGTSSSFNREVWAGFFTLSAGQTRTITLTWTEKGVAQKDGTGWHYQYLVQRQAGSQWMLNIQITLPSCAVRTHTTGGLASRNGQTATLAQPLAKNMSLGVDYNC